MGHRITFLSAFLIISLILTSQYQPAARSYINEYRKAEELYNAENATAETDSLALNHYQNTIELLGIKNIDDSVFFDAFMKAGILAMTAHQDSLALLYFSRAISLQKSTSSIPDSMLFRSYLFAGSSQYNLYNYDSAAYYYKQAEALQQKYPTIPEVERLYNKSGVLYYETGDYKKSITYFSKALSTVEAAAGDNQYFIINYKNNIASALRKLQNYDQALLLYKSLLPYKINTNELWHNIGVTYLDAGNYDEAITYLQKVNYRTIARYNDISRAYLKKQDYGTAAKTLQEAIVLQEQSNSNSKSVQHGITLKYLGDLNMALAKPAEATRYYQQAIIQMDPDFYDTTITSNPASFNGLHQYAYLFDALVAKARAIKNTAPAKPTMLSLRTALTAYRSSITLAAHVEKMYETEEARLFLKKNADTAYKEYVALGLQIYEQEKNEADLQDVFSVIENSKASVLQTELHELELSGIPGLPQGLIQAQKKLKTELARLNISASQSGRNSLDSSTTIKTRELEIALSQMQERLNEDPKYQSLKFTSRQTKIDTIQQNLLSATDAILSYYYANNQLYCFYITKDQFGYTQTPISGAFTKNILTLRGLLNTTGAGDRKTMQTITTDLYATLISPVISKLVNKKHLVIIPYNEIGYIPFEILTDPANDALLLRKFAVRYNYSANFIDAEKLLRGDYAVLALAPFTTAAGRQGQPILKASEEEVRDLKGKMLQGKDATKNNFIAVLGQYPIIHLATHAIANDLEPIQSYISFYGTVDDSTSNYRLYTPEIYNLNMSHVNLVILSACETGSGQLVNGEGIMSLSRAFSYAGCKSTIASLWKADDVATGYITRKMHQYLARGMEKDIALQEAKLDYLDNSTIEARYKTPAYWSHLVLIGDGQPVVSAGWNWWLIVAILLAFIGIIIRFRKKAARN